MFHGKRSNIFLKNWQSFSDTNFQNYENYLIKMFLIKALTLRSRIILAFAWCTCIRWIVAGLQCVSWPVFFSCKPRCGIFLARFARRKKIWHKPSFLDVLDNFIFFVPKISKIFQKISDFFQNFRKFTNISALPNSQMWKFHIQMWKKNTAPLGVPDKSVITFEHWTHLDWHPWT